MEMVTLPNGIKEAKFLVAGTILTLQTLLKEKVMVFYDLVMMCRDRDYEAFGDNDDELKKWGLLEGNGRPHSSIINIVNAVVKGDELDMRIEPLE